MKYLLIISCLLFTSVGWSQEYGEQQKFMDYLIRETIMKNESAVNSASKTRNWIKASKKLCEIGGIFDAYGPKKDWYGKVKTINMDDDGTVNIEIDIGNGNSVKQYTIKESLIDSVLEIPTKSMVKFSGYFVKGNISENECLSGGITASPDMLDEFFWFKFTDIVKIKSKVSNCKIDPPELQKNPSHANGPSQLPSVLIDKIFPSITLSRLADYKLFSYKNLINANGPSLVNIWSSWCVPCKIENEYLMRMSEDHNIIIYGINYNDDKQDAIKYLNLNGDPFYAIGVDQDGKQSTNIGVYGVPETFIIDREGNIRYRHVGPIQEYDMKNTILPILNKLKC